MTPNIFVQIGLYKTCDLADITNDPSLFESKDSLFTNIWSLPKEVLNRLGDQHVVGVDMHPKSKVYTTSSTAVLIFRARVQCLSRTEHRRTAGFYVASFR